MANGYILTECVTYEIGEKLDIIASCAQEIKENKDPMK